MEFSLLHLQLSQLTIGRIFCVPNPKRPRRSKRNSHYKLSEVNRFAHRGFTTTFTEDDVIASPNHPDNFTATYSGDSLLRRTKLSLNQNASGFMQTDYGHSSPRPVSSHGTSNGVPFVGECGSKIYRSLQVQLTRLETSVNCVRKQNEELCDAIRGSDRVRTVRSLKLEWQNLATLIDRACFVMFLVGIISSLIWLFPRPAPAENMVD